MKLFLRVLVLILMADGALAELCESPVVRLPKTLTTVDGHDLVYYQGWMESVFKVAPPTMKKGMCAVNFTISDDAGTSMYSPPNSIYLHSKLFNKVPSIGWSMKYASNPNLYHSAKPDEETSYQIEVAGSKDFQSTLGVIFLYVSHELGHYFQLVNYPACWANLNCSLGANGYESILWQGFAKMTNPDHRDFRSQFCNDLAGDACSSSAAPIDAVIAYKKLAELGLPTPFSILSREEDFAETFSFWLLSQVIESIHISNGAETFDLLAPIKTPSPAYQQKILHFEAL